VAEQGPGGGQGGPAAGAGGGSRPQHHACSLAWWCWKNRQRSVSRSNERKHTSFVVRGARGRGGVCCLAWWLGGGVDAAGGRLFRCCNGSTDETTLSALSLSLMRVPPTKPTRLPSLSSFIHPPEEQTDTHKSEDTLIQTCLLLNRSFRSRMAWQQFPKALKAASLAEARGLLRANAWMIEGIRMKSSFCSQGSTTHSST